MNKLSFIVAGIAAFFVAATATAQIDYTKAYHSFPDAEDVVEADIEAIRSEAAAAGGAIGLQAAGCGAYRPDVIAGLVVWTGHWNNEFGTGDDNDVMAMLTDLSSPMFYFFADIAQTEGCAMAVGMFMQMDMIIEAQGEDSPTIQFGFDRPSITGTVMNYFVPGSL